MMSNTESILVLSYFPLILIEETLSTDMGYTVVELTQLSVVPPVGSTYEVASDAL